MPTPPFNPSASLRMQICSGLRELASKRAANTIEPEDATSAAHGLILAYLREVVAAPDMADAFAGAVGIEKP